jgi:hypothetical protein
MKCPTCQHENAPGSRFCSKCAAALIPAAGFAPVFFSGRFGYDEGREDTREQG